MSVCGSSGHHINTETNKAAHFLELLQDARLYMKNNFRTISLTLKTTLIYS